MTDDLTLIITPAGGGDATALSGWTQVRVTRGIERLPSDFQVTATAPGGPLDVRAHAGDLAQVLLGGDPVLTGYVDRVIPAFAPGSHTVTILGRSKCEDLVDCSAVFETFQLTSMSLPDLANRLSADFKIKAKVIDGDIGPKIGTIIVPQVNVALMETAWEIIERVCRYGGVLAYDDTDGNLILSRVGSTSMASGFAQAQNVQGAVGLEGMDQRFSKYVGVFASTQTLFEMPPDNFNPLTNNSLGFALDPGVPRYRPLVLVAEQNDLNFTVLKNRLGWEAARRYGRSKQIRVVADSWRDSAGMLWQTNALAPVDVPAAGVSGEVWLITEVSFLRDERGTRAELVLMPKEAFSVEPINLNPASVPLVQAANAAAVGAADGQIVSAPLPPPEAAK